MLVSGCGKDEAVILPERSTVLSGEQSDDINDTAEVPGLKTGDEEPHGRQLPDEEPGQVTVYVCGAVERPGVYTLDEGKRISDAVELAGGMNEEADRDYINQAMLLSDSQKIYIPRLGEMMNASYEENGINAAGSGTGSERVLGRVNINTGSEQELMTLPGIGEAKARLIIEYRDDNGGFSSIEDIMKIKGIKEGMFDKIKDMICI